MGLPILSLTFRRSPFRVRTRVEMVVGLPFAAFWAAALAALESLISSSSISPIPADPPMLLLKNGFAQKKPSSRTVPTYLPNRMHTRAWPGCSEKKPLSGRNQKQNAAMLSPRPQP